MYVTSVGITQRIKLTSNELRRIQRKRETKIKKEKEEEKQELREIKIGGFGLQEDWHLLLPNLSIYLLFILWDWIVPKEGCP